MRKTIFKYCPEFGHTTLFLNKGYEVLAVGNQNGSLCIWILQDLDASEEKLEISVFGTGMLLPDSFTKETYFGTAILNALVWHVFKRHTQS